jgi:hypothetical protein
MVENRHRFPVSVRLRNGVFEDLKEYFPCSIPIVNSVSKDSEIGF